MKAAADRTDTHQVDTAARSAASPADASRAEAFANAQIDLAFAPLHKSAFGIAVGAAAGLLIAGVTLLHLLIQPPDGPNLGLLANYFYGYRVTWVGILIGAGWSFAVGFVAGWFVAFCRNLILAISVFVTRTRVELAQTRDFLDHI